MRLGISALLFNLDKALELCREVDRINHIEVGIDNLDECIKLSKYKGEFDKLNLSLGIHLPMELNSCENIKYIRKSWIDFINKIEDVAKKTIEKELKKQKVTFSDVKTELTRETSSFIRSQTGRKPIVLPIILNIKK